MGRGLRPPSPDPRGRLYGRGTADNKGQHLINLMALEAVPAARGRLGFPSGDRDGGGDRSSHALFNQEREALTADALIASDGPRVSMTVRRSSWARAGRGAWI